MKRWVAVTLFVAGALVWGGVYAQAPVSRKLGQLSARRFAVNPFVRSMGAHRQREIRRAVVFGGGGMAGAVVLGAHLARRRRGLLRKIHEDPAEAWFRYFMTTQTVSFAAVPLVLIPSTQVDWRFLLRNVAHVHPRLLMAVLEVGALAGPYLLLTGFATALLYLTYTQMRGLQISRKDVFLHGLVSALIWAVPVLVVLLALFAMLSDDRPGLAAGLVFSAGSFWVLLQGLRWKVFKVRMERLPSCPLSESVHSLAEKAGVKLTALQILTPGARFFPANAFSTPGGTLILTDHLVENLTARELDAIVSHELIHLRRKHPERGLWLIMIGAGLFGLGMVGFSAALEKMMPVSRVNKGLLLSIPSLLLLAALWLVWCALSRRSEKKADADAVKLTGDPEASITALIKAARLGLWPADWKKRHELILSHPSAMRRVRAVAREVGMSGERLEELIKRGSTGESSYAVPASVFEATILFSTKHHVKIVIRVLVSIFGWCTLVPFLMALGIVHWELEGPARIAAYAAGMLAAPAGLVWLTGYLMMAGNRKLARRLQRKLVREGLDIAGRHAMFVGFSPDDSPMSYLGSSNTDVGFALVAGDRLCFFGDSMKFALSRNNVVSAEPGRLTIGWYRSRPIIVEWRGDGGEEGRFCISCEEVRNGRRIGAANRRLLEMIKAWQQRQPEAIAAGASTFEGLGLPGKSSVIGSPLGIGLPLVLINSLMPLTFAGILCHAFGLFSGADFSPVVFAAGTAAWTFIAYELPWLKWRV